MRLSPKLEAETCGSRADVARRILYLVSGQVRPLELLIDQTTWGFGCPSQASNVRAASSYNLPAVSDDFVAHLRAASDLESTLERVGHPFHDL